jgi:hypothetical protein
MIVEKPQTGTNVRPPRYIKHCREHDAAKWISLTYRCTALRTSPSTRECHVHAHAEVNADLTSGIYLDFLGQHAQEHDAWRLANTNDGLMYFYHSDWSGETPTMHLGIVLAPTSSARPNDPDAARNCCRIAGKREARQVLYSSPGHSPALEDHDHSLSLCSAALP